MKGLLRGYHLPASLTFTKTSVPDPVPTDMLVPSHRLSEARIMKPAVRKWFSDRWASRRSRTSSAYWRTLPMLSMGKFLVAAFITWCAVGFVIDLLLVNYHPLGRGFFWPIYFGTLGTALFAARMRRIGL